MTFEVALQSGQFIPAGYLTIMSWIQSFEPNRTEAKSHSSGFTRLARIQTWRQEGKERRSLAKSQNSDKAVSNADAAAQRCEKAKRKWFDDV